MSVIQQLHQCCSRRLPQNKGLVNPTQTLKRSECKDSVQGKNSPELCLLVRREDQHPEDFHLGSQPVQTKTRPA